MEHKFELKKDVALAYCGFNDNMLSIAKKIIDELNEYKSPKLNQKDYNSVEKAIRCICDIELNDEDYQWEIVRFYSISPDDVASFCDAKENFIEDVISCVAF